MSVHLSVGDCVLVTTEIGCDIFGLIKYIGYIHNKMNINTECIGLELIEPIPNGHDGTINGYKYFTAPKGHGIHIQINQVIKKLSVCEIMMKFKNIINVFKTKLSQYVNALTERDEYIEKLKQKQKDLKLLVNQSTTCNHNKNIYKNNHNNFQKQSFSTISTKTAHIKKLTKSKSAGISNLKQSDKISDSTNLQMQNQNYNNTQPIQPIQTYHHPGSPIYFTPFQPTVYTNKYQSIQSPLSPLSPIQYQIIPTHQSHIHFKRMQSIKTQHPQNTVIMPQYMTHQTQPQRISIENGILVNQSKISIGLPNIERRSTK
eukprot:359683_1